MCVSRVYVCAGARNILGFFILKLNRLHREKFLGTATRNLVVEIVFNNVFRVEITWSYLVILSGKSGQYNQM